MRYFTGLLNSLERSKNEDLFDESPFLFPWYVQEAKPRLLHNGRILRWKYEENIGDKAANFTTLTNGSELLGIFKIYTFIYPSKTKTSFCVWNQRYTDVLAGRDLKLEIFDVSDLQPIELRGGIIDKVNGDKDFDYHLNCGPGASAIVPLHADLTSIEVECSEQLDGFDSFIAVINIKNLYLDDNRANGTAMVEIIPDENKIEIYPQDWFNLNPQIDFGYQWITRAFRNRSTGRIHGQGIRIDPFELDETNRQLTSRSKA